MYTSRQKTPAAIKQPKTIATKGTELKNELGLNYRTGKEALRENEPELAKAKSYQEMMYLVGNTLDQSTVLARQRFKLNGDNSIQRV